MDSDTKEEFKTLNEKLDDVKETLTKHVSFEEGLSIPKRMVDVEEAIDNKPSWGALVGIVFAFCTILGIVINVLNGKL